MSDKNMYRIDRDDRRLRMIVMITRIPAGTTKRRDSLCTRKRKRWYGFPTGDLVPNTKISNATSVNYMDTSNGTVPNMHALIVATIVDTDLTNVQGSPLVMIDETP